MFSRHRAMKAAQVLQSVHQTRNLTQNHHRNLGHRDSNHMMKSAKTHRAILIKAIKTKNRSMTPSPPQAKLDFLP
jgi:plasmid stability protein